jgi:hypothetical protein
VNGIKDKLVTSFYGYVNIVARMMTFADTVAGHAPPATR